MPKRSRRRDKAKIVRIPGWLTTQEAADYLGCSPGQIRWYVHKGYLPMPARLSEAPGSALLHKESEIANYKESHPQVGKIRARNLLDAASS